MPSQITRICRLPPGDAAAQSDIQNGGYPRVQADQAQLLGVIRFQVGLQRYRRLFAAGLQNGAALKVLILSGSV
jgi:hypothetical protein